MEAELARKDAEIARLQQQVLHLEVSQRILADRHQIVPSFSLDPPTRSHLFCSPFFSNAE